MGKVGGWTHRGDKNLRSMAPPWVSPGYMSCTPFPAILSVLSTSHSTDIREVGPGEDAPEAPWLSVSTPRGATALAQRQLGPEEDHR